MTSLRQHTIKIAVDRDMEVSAVIAEPENSRVANADIVILAHGAGSNMHHPFMTFFHEELARSGWVSVKFNFPYKEQGRKAPDPAARLEDAFERVLNYVRSNLLPAQGRVFIGGKSMGGRIAANIAARETVSEGRSLAGLVFLGYPLHAPSRYDKLRAENLLKIRMPMLFIEGTNDPFCRLDLLDDVLAQASAESTTHRIEGGNHDFRVPKRLGREVEDIWREVVDVVCQWRTRQHTSRERSR